MAEPEGKKRRLRTAIAKLKSLNSTHSMKTALGGQGAVIPAAVSANQPGFTSLVQSNVFGMNFPAIAAAEGQYEEMWAQDVNKMIGG